MTNIRSVALKYYKRELPVISLCRPTDTGCVPHGENCEQRGKKPLRNWKEFQGSLPLKEQINEWFFGSDESNIGLLTGAQSGILVIDCDSETAARRFVEEFPEAATTLQVKTGKPGGIHYYFNFEEGIRNDVGTKLGPGIDVRGEGGYVVAPPSLHANGNKYRFINFLKYNKPLPLPEKLKARLTNQTADRANSQSVEKREPLDVARILKGVPEGQRDDALFRLACKLRTADVPIDYAEKLILVSAQNCEPPFPEASALEKVKRAYETYNPAPDRTSDSFPSYKEEVRKETNFNPISSFEILTKPEVEVPWLWEDYIAEGTLNLLVAFMKVGKTTLAYPLALAIARGEPFLGKDTKQGGVLILALEEHPRDIEIRLKTLGLIKGDPIYVHEGSLVNKETELAAIGEFVQQKGIKFILLDSLSVFWEVHDENDNASVTRQIKPLLKLARDTNTALCLIHHEKKAGGEHGRGIRGASALFGLVDQAIMLDRTLGGSENQRSLKTYGRYSESPKEVIIELMDGEYRVVGTPQEVSKEANKQKVLAALTVDPIDIPKISEETGLTQKAAREACKVLVEQGKAIQEGGGRKGDPYRYGLPDPGDSFLSDSPSIGEETKSIPPDRSEEAA